MAGDDRDRAVIIRCLHFGSFSETCCRDRMAALIRKKLGISDSDLTLAQILESATWKGGREIAKQKRPETGGPPIEIESDGTVF